MNYSINGPLFDQFCELLSSKLKDKEELLQKHFDSLIEGENCKDKKTRFVWDCLWASNLKIGDGKGISGEIALPFNDSHIETALKRWAKSRFTWYK